MSSRRAIYVESRTHRRLAAAAAERRVMVSALAEDALASWLDGTSPTPVAAPPPAPPPLPALVDPDLDDEPTVRGVRMRIVLPRCVVDLLHERARELDLGVPAFIREALTRWMLRQRPEERDRDAVQE